jgi:hypothetical protein
MGIAAAAAAEGLPANATPQDVAAAATKQGMSTKKKLLIGVAVVVVILLCVFLYGYFEHPGWWPSWMPKDGFVIGNGFGYGWDASDYMYGAAMMPPVPCTSPYSGVQSCDMECRQYPQGMSYTDCMYHCGNKTKQHGPPGGSCANGSCAR